MSKIEKKPIILAFIGNYLPGYKAGGILRVTINTVDYLCEEFDFWIVTRDRDLGDDRPYPEIKVNQWQQVGNAMVYYMTPNFSKVNNILNLIVDTPHHLLYLNSFFDPFTVKVLLNRRFHKAYFKNVIVAPWGEFAWASLKQKHLKKLVFIQIAKLIGLYDNITWRTSSKFEAQDVIKIMKPRLTDIQIVRDLPIKNMPEMFSDVFYSKLDDIEELRIVFLSRISREKNLDYALEVLRKVKSKLVFDIYGPTENIQYWKECQELISKLPYNVKVSYKGVVEPSQVIHVFGQYDLFFFPTGGEAYGHAIAECLISGTPVLISTETPWRDLKNDELGWDLDLAEMDAFVQVIESLSLMSKSERLQTKGVVRSRIVKRLLDPIILEENRQLFKMQLL
jgi:glycosyltransferase involved in cell wall biosynthesis